MKRTKFWVRIRESFWILPILFSILAVLLAILAINMDYHFTTDQYKNYLPKIMVTTVKTETQIASTLTTSILTMMTITFSAIMVVLTTFSGQFSPRTLQDFIMDNGTKRTLAIFVAGIVYNLLIMLFLKSAHSTTMFFSPAFSVIVALFCILGFVYFIHHVAKWVQVNELINKVSHGTVKTIHRVKDEMDTFGENAPEHQNFQKENFSHQTSVQSQASGYIGVFDTNRLMRLAKQDDVLIEFLVHVGAYVIEEKPLMVIHSKKPLDHINKNDYASCVKVDIERRDVQDIEFGIQKLVEIALRAISPAVNDPHTAINCINRIAALITELDLDHLKRSHLYDDAGHLRVIYQSFDFYHYLYKGFYQIRHYGRSDVSVTAAIFHAFGLIAENASVEMKETVRRFALEIKEGVDHSDYLAMDEAYLQKEIEFMERVTHTGSEIV